METISPSPAKKLRFVNNIDVTQIKECKREFVLPRQYLSMVPKLRNDLSTNIKGPINASIRQIASKNIPISNKMHKLRLKSHTGKDLGVLNGQLLSRENSIFKDKAFMLNKQHSSKIPNKPVILTISTPRDKIVPEKLRNISSEETLISSKTCQNSVTLPESLPSNITSVAIKSKVPSITRSSLKLPTNCENSRIERRKCNSEEQLLSKKTKKDDYLCSADTNNLNCIKDSMTVNDSQTNINENYNANNTSSLNCNYRSVEEANMSLCKEKSIDTNRSQENKLKLGTNVMVIIHDENFPPKSDSNDCESKWNNKQCLLNIDIFKEGHHAVSPFSSESSITNIETNPSIVEETAKLFSKNEDNKKLDTASKSRESLTEDVSLKQKLFDNWNVIQKALNTTTDEELRTEALKVFTDCGINVERPIFVNSNKDSKSICDKDVQTDIVTFPEQNNFVSERKDEPRVQRTDLKEQHISNAVNDSLNIEPSNDLSLNENFNYFSDDYDIYQLCHELCFNNENSNTVSEVLSPSSSQPKQIFEQLRKDFETVKKFDEKGMLNIHRAVISRNMNDVRRHLMILKACNEDINILTQTGMTALALAILYEAPIQIVKFLLEAGAHPISDNFSSIPVLNLAIKRNSPLLPVLINSVSPVELLNKKDSMGFSALHYCALSGNVEGVISLITAGAYIDLKDDKSGRTALFHALENHHYPVSRKLIESGADVNIPNFAGQTVLSLTNTIKSFSLQTLINRSIK